MPTVECTAIDCLPAAVALSRRNAARLGLATTGEGRHGARRSVAMPMPPLPPLPSELAAVVGDGEAHGEGQLAEPSGEQGGGVHCTYTCEELSLGEFALQRAATGAPRFDFILSNPPYIPSGKVQMLQPEVQRFESILALDGGKDGLDMVKDLLQLAPALLRSTDASADAGGELWMEVDEMHPAQVAQWFEEGCTKGIDKKLRLIALRNDQYAKPRFIGVGVARQPATATEQ